MSKRKSSGTRARLFTEQDGKCHYCGREMILTTAKHAKAIGQFKELITVDHIVPVVKGGTRADGIVGACLDCNSNRGDMPYSYFKLIRSNPKFRVILKEWKRRKSRFRALHCEMRNRTKPYRPYVYV